MNEPGTPEKPVLLSARGLSAGYGSVAVLQDLDLEIRAGEVLALLGRNGAGKSTTAMALAGRLKPTAGTIEVAGRAVHGSSLSQRARRGTAYISQERCVFMGLSVRDNLRVGGVEPDEALELFPELKPHLKRRVGLLSGGQQQILAVARALARHPQIMISDELSLGLAPMVVDRIFDVLTTAAQERGLGVLLIEQQVGKALAVSDRTAVMRRGRIEITESSSALTDRMQEISELYV
ncbi:ABC transporter ATP-binding protein [Actinomadura sp. 1N219]|uniref:ABC transporter ATP-binding protein n=1 Tax=Actinomadura sp. 1N219 TaxID=3375152 RepID=UPI0037BBCC57